MRAGDLDAITVATKHTVQLPWIGMLFFLFLTLKLTRTIDWSWWWVTCPLWAILAVIAILALAAGAMYTLYGLICVWQFIWRSISRR